MKAMRIPRMPRTLPAHLRMGKPSVLRSLPAPVALYDGCDFNWATSCTSYASCAAVIVLAGMAWHGETTVDRPTERAAKAASPPWTIKGGSRSSPSQRTGSEIGQGQGRGPVPKPPQHPSKQGSGIVGRESYIRDDPHGGKGNINGSSGNGKVSKNPNVSLSATACGHSTRKRPPAVGASGIGASSIGIPPPRASHAA